jgi:Glycosyltransferase 61
LETLVTGSLASLARDFVPFASWITDDWSMAYFHWITDALPRLYAVRSQVADATLLLPRPYEDMEYVRSSLAPFGIPCVRYIKEMTLCKTLMLPTRAAPTGNYNEILIRGLRDFYQMAYQKGPSEKFSTRIYISRGNAGRRKIANESESPGSHHSPRRAWFCSLLYGESDIRPANKDCRKCRSYCFKSRCGTDQYPIYIHLVGYGFDGLALNQFGRSRWLPGGMQRFRIRNFSIR